MLEHSPHGVPRSVRGVLLLVLFAMASASCAKLSAAHLHLKPWENGGRQDFSAKFMRFEYQTTPQGDVLEIKGSAWPVRESLPAWADSVDGLSISAYLCDSQGNVLATVTTTYPAQKIPPAGFGFDFLLKHEQQPAGGYFVSFGYGGKFTASRPPSGPGKGSGGLAGNYVFFASEQAALKK